jgi:hypothetical protein
MELIISSSSDSGLESTCCKRARLVNPVSELEVQLNKDETESDALCLNAFSNGELRNMEVGTYN